MIVTTLDSVVGTDRDVAGDGWRSRRLLLRRDGLGFSLHDTLVAAGSRLEMAYTNHLEACYCIEGEAEILDLATDERHELRAGTVYALDRHDRHVITVRQDLRLVCVFNPPLSGGETHDASGGFPVVEGDA